MSLRNLNYPPWLPRAVLLGLSILGWGLAIRGLVAAVAASVVLQGEEIGGLGVDTYAYWLAGANLAAGGPVYEAAAINEIGAYFYPPPFAQAWIPVSALPHAFVEWAWRILGLLSIRYMAGSWLISGIWMIYPGTIVELAAGNVTFQVAALTVAGLRGRAEGIFPAALVKFSTFAVVPFLWFRRPEARRGLLIGAAIAAAVVLVSMAIDLGLWRDYFATIGGQSDLSFEGTTIIHILPTAGADYALRLVIMAAIVVASVRFGSPHLAFIAAVIATPTLWDQRLAVMFALLTLEGGQWLQPYLQRRRSGDSPSDPVDGEEDAPLGATS